MEHDDKSIEEYCRDGDKVLWFGVACIVLMLVGTWWSAVPA